MWSQANCFRFLKLGFSSVKRVWCCLQRVVVRWCLVLREHEAPLGAPSCLGVSLLRERNGAIVAKSHRHHWQEQTGSARMPWRIGKKCGNSVPWTEAAKRKSVKLDGGNSLSSSTELAEGNKDEMSFLAHPNGTIPFIRNVQNPPRKQDQRGAETVLRSHSWQA